MMRCLLCVFLCLLNSYAFAHDMGDGAHLTTVIANKDVGYTETWTVEITLQELIAVFPEYDTDEDGRITSKEYGVLNVNRVSEYLISKIDVANESGSCGIQVTSPEIVRHQRADYLKYLLDVRCQSLSSEIAIKYDLFFDQNPYHQGTWTVIYNGQPTLFYFWEDERFRTFVIQQKSWMSIVSDFVWLGMEHIAIGYDHLLFLFALLLVSVLRREQGAWQAESATSKAVRNLILLITAFTVAHSLTLTMAVLDWVPTPPSALTESLIALSVILVALNNLKPVLKHTAAVTFVFGLIHGFGFANVLLEYELETANLVLSLVSFNLGVELGQLGIALTLFAPLLLVRHAQQYRTLVMPGLSALIAMIAAYWLAERLGDFSYFY